MTGKGRVHGLNGVALLVHTAIRLVGVGLVMIGGLGGSAVVEVEQDGKDN